MELATRHEIGAATLLVPRLRYASTTLHGIVADRLLRRMRQAGGERIIG